jgi:predicted kinase
MIQYKNNNIAAVNDYEFVSRTFDVPVEVCIQRDLGREKPVGKDVILHMAEKYLPLQPF